MIEKHIGPQDALPDLQFVYDGLILHLIELNGLTLEPGLVLAVIRHESQFNPLAESFSGAEGLGQFTDGTWREFDPDPTTQEPEQDVFESVSRLVAKLARLVPWARKRAIAADVVKFVAAAYNAGEGNIGRAAARAAAAGADPQQWGNVDAVLEEALKSSRTSVWPEDRAAAWAKAKVHEVRSEVEAVEEWTERYRVHFAQRGARS
jgi:membrane-bound lytic murein transglycosylase MltF